MKKYEFTGETMKKDFYSGEVTLRRIRAAADFPAAKAGDLGGWIETEENLSREGGAWVSGEAKVYGGAQVYGEAKVYGEAEVYGRAIVCGKAEVYGGAKIYGEAKVYGRAIVCEEAEVRGEAQVYGGAEVYGRAIVCGKAEVYEEAEVCGEAIVCDKAKVCGEAGIFLGNHVVTVGRIGSRSGVTTFYRGKNGQVMVKCGCFNGTSDRFIERVEDTHGGTKHAAVYKAAVALARAQIGPL